MLLADKWALRHSESLRVRLAQAMVDAAYNIQNEDPETTDHALRLQWANGVLLHKDAPLLEAERLQHRLLLNPAVAAAGESAPDGDIVYVLAAEILPFVVEEMRP